PGTEPSPTKGRRRPPCRRRLRPPIFIRSSGALSYPPMAGPGLRRSLVGSSIDPRAPNPDQTPRPREPDDQAGEIAAGPAFPRPTLGVDEDGRCGPDPLTAAKPADHLPPAGQLRPAFLHELLVLQGVVIVHEVLADQGPPFAAFLQRL